MQLYDNNLSHAVRELFLLDAPDRLPGTFFFSFLSFFFVFVFIFGENKQRIE